MLVLAILGLLLVACQPVRPLPPGTAATAAPASQEEQNAAIVRRFYDEFSAGNADVILQVHPETIRMHYAGEFEDVPAQVLRDDLAAIKAANPDLRAIVHTNIAAGDYVFTELTWTTTHTSDYFGIPATKSWGEPPWPWPSILCAASILPNNRQYHHARHVSDLRAVRDLAGP
jgi:hypothetical protein